MFSLTSIQCDERECPLYHIKITCNQYDKRGFSPHYVEIIYLDTVIDHHIYGHDYVCRVQIFDSTKFFARQIKFVNSTAFGIKGHPIFGI